ncbi:MAG TPA: hypothetical protein VH796_11340 [Nitrososphaeraceae archaeon]|jgi:hypothetical protein
MNESQRELRSISCILAESRVPYHDCNESNLYQLLPGGHSSSIISDVNSNFHNNVSNYDRSEKAGEKHVQVCYNIVIPIFIPIVYNYYPEIHLWTKEYLITNYLENQKSLLSNLHDRSQDIKVL